MTALYTLGDKLPIVEKIMLPGGEIIKRRSRCDACQLDCRVQLVHLDETCSVLGRRGRTILGATPCKLCSSCLRTVQLVDLSVKTSPLVVVYDVRRSRRKAKVDRYKVSTYLRCVACKRMVRTYEIMTEGRAVIETKHSGLVLLPDKPCPLCARCVEKVEPAGRRPTRGTLVVPPDFAPTTPPARFKRQPIQSREKERKMSTTSTKKSTVTTSTPEKGKEVKKMSATLTVKEAAKVLKTDARSLRRLLRNEGDAVGQGARYEITRATLKALARKLGKKIAVK